MKAVDPLATGVRAARPLGSERGFTLLELLVMLVVLGLLMVSLAQGTRLGLRARQIDTGMQTGAAELETTARVMRQLIARAEPSDPTGQEAAFVGTEHAASFVTTLPAGFAAATTSEADVSLGVGAGHRLELRWLPHYRRWLVPPPVPTAATLLNGVERLDLSFWQSRPGSAAGSWVTAWKATELPALVRLRVVFAAGDRRHWPDIVVAPKREAPRQ